MAQAINEFGQPEQVIYTGIAARGELLGFKHGQAVTTCMPLIDGFKDENGYNIYVHSHLRNKSEWLHPGEYKLPEANS